MYKYLLIVLLTPLLLQAEMLISPFDVMKAEFGDKAKIEKKNTMLHNDEAKRVQSMAKVKLSTKIYRIFSATDASGIMGYGILVSQKVRTKKATMLYLFSPKGEMLSTEVIAFNEPHEFIPSSTWLQQFKHKTSTDTLQVGKDIPTITGATMSARSVADASRVARAIFDVLLSGK